VSCLVEVLEKLFSLLGSPSRCAPVKHKIGEKYSKAQQYTGCLQENGAVSKIY
jgi:hypothetical protein